MEDTFQGVPYVDDFEECHNDYNGVFRGGEPMEPEQRYRYGQCHALALAICMERPGWTLSQTGDWSHVLATAPDGTAVDIGGVWDEVAEYGALWDPPEFADWEDLAYYIERDTYAVPVVDKFTRQVARDVLERCGM